MSAVKPKPCVKCGSEDIGIKDTIVVLRGGYLARSTWAYCRSCGEIGESAVFTIDDNDAEINEAFTLWNLKGKNHE